MFVAQVCSPMKEAPANIERNRVTVFGNTNIIRCCRKVLRACSEAERASSERSAERVACGSGYAPASASLELRLPAAPHGGIIPMRDA